MAGAGDPGTIAIIGAGPCGLACARELAGAGHDDWRLYERDAVAGGHAGSVVDEAGFTWDLGGHVVFSHFGEFDHLLEEAMGDELEEHERASYIHFAGRWVPYPFQNNLRYLPPETAYECLLGLIEADRASLSLDFGSWLEQTFGAGLTRHFMRPYNEKVWAVPLERMSSKWIGERVSVVDYRRALRSVVLQQDDVGWGPNNTFKFPRSGGTGEIYRRVADALGCRVDYARELVAVDADARTLRFADGAERGYDTLVSTMPLDRLVGALASCPGEVRAAAASLEHNGVWVVGVGYERPLEDDRCWMYFPDTAVPFYRVTNFAHYAAANVPRGDVGRYSSLLTETSYPAHRPVAREGLERTVPSALGSVGLVSPGAAVASTHAVDIEYAYPIPTRSRDEALRVVQQWLLGRGIYSRGRFGAWRYEIGNMDHAVKMGIDLARHLLDGRPEELWTV